MKIHLKLTYCFTVLLFAISFVGCKNLQPDSNSQINDQIKNVDTLHFAKSNIEYLLPSPEEILEVIFNNDIQYKPNLMLGTEVQGKAINSNYQALMLGIYISDFSYAILYNDFNTCSKNLMAIQNLSDQIGIGGTFKNQYYNRIQNNLSNMDSISSIYSDISKNSFSTLASSGNMEWLSLIAMGASIESIYLGYNVLKTESFSNSLKPFFIEQRMVFENFYQNYMVYNKSKEDLEKLNTDINSFYSLFKLNIWLIVDKDKISNADSDSLLDVKYIVKTNEECIDTLGESICILRNNLVNLYYQK